MKEKRRRWKAEMEIINDRVMERWKREKRQQAKELRKWWWFSHSYPTRRKTTHGRRLSRWFLIVTWNLGLVPSTCSSFSFNISLHTWIQYFNERTRRRANYRENTTFSCSFLLPTEFSILKKKKKLRGEANVLFWSSVHPGARFSVSYIESRSGPLCADLVSESDGLRWRNLNTLDCRTSFLV